MTMRSKLCWCCLLSGALLFAWTAASGAQEEGVPAGGEEEAQESVDLGEVVVTAPRYKRPQVKVVSEQELATEGQSKTAEGRLENLAGVDLGRRSPAGSESSRLTIRGFDESRSSVLLDGRSLHGAGVYGGYYVDWASLSLEDVESIEVIRGVAPAKYGNTLGGVVNVVTSEPSEEPCTKLRTAYGSLATWDIQASHSAGVSDFLYGLAFGHHETDGHLRNSFLDRETFSARMTVKLPRDLELRLSGRFTSNASGMTAYNMPDAYDYDPDYPDSLGGQLGGAGVRWVDDETGPKYWGDGSYWKDRRLQLDAGIFRESEDMEFSFQTYLFDQDREEFFYANDAPGHLVLERDAEPENNNFGWKTDLRNNFESRGKHVLEYGAEGHYLGYGGVDVVSYDPTYFSPVWPPSDSPGKDTVTTWHGLYVQDSWEVRDDVELELGLRLDDYVADGPEATAPYVRETPVSPRIACDWKAWQGGRLSLRYGRAYRFPTNPEYYWWYGGFDPSTIGVDRKDLTSEKANQYELEVAHETKDRFSVVLRGYHYEVDDYIRTIFGYPMGRVIYNIDRVDFQGIEFEAAYDVSRSFKIWANYTYQDTEKHGDILDHSMELTNELLELPENKFNFGVGYRHENGFEARLKLRYVSDRWAIRGDLATPGGSSFHKMDSFVDMDVQARLPIWRGDSDRKAFLELAVENILGQDIVEEYGYPHPGTTFMVGVRAVF